MIKMSQQIEYTMTSNLPIHFKIISWFIIHVYFLWRGQCANRKMLLFQLWYKLYLMSCETWKKNGIIKKMDQFTRVSFHDVNHPVFYCHRVFGITKLASIPKGIKGSNLGLFHLCCGCKLSVLIFSVCV